MSSIFTEEELATFAPFEKTEKTVVDNINVANNECPDGFEKNTKGECVEKVKENGVAETDASVAPEINTASISDPGSSDSTKIDTWGFQWCKNFFTIMGVSSGANWWVIFSVFLKILRQYSEELRVTVVINIL